MLILENNKYLAPVVWSFCSENKYNLFYNSTESEKIIIGYWAEVTKVFLPTNDIYYLLKKFNETINNLTVSSRKKNGIYHLVYCINFKNVSRDRAILISGGPSPALQKSLDLKMIC